MKDPEPEILVPPDMENLEIEEIPKDNRFPFKRLAIMMLLSFLLIVISGMGVSVYMTTGKIGEVIPY